MSNKKHVLFVGMIVCLMFISVTVLALDHIRVIGDVLDQHGNAIVPSALSGNGYVIAGWTMRPITGTNNKTKDAMVMMVGAEGSPVNFNFNNNIYNAAIFGGNKDDEATSMIMIPNDGYVVTGWTRSYNSVGTNADIFVIKFGFYLIASHNVPLAALSLRISWANVYHIVGTGTGNVDPGHRANSIVRVTNSGGGTDGYILTGYLLSSDNATHYILVLCLDANGGFDWARTYKVDNNSYNEGFSITEVKDNPNVKFAVVGRTAATLGMNVQGDAFIMRLNGSGDVQNPTRVFKSPYDDHARSVLWDGSVVSPGIMVAGMTNGVISPNSSTPLNIWVARISAANGSVAWSKVYRWAAGSDLVDYIQGDKALIRVTGNARGGFILSGITYSRGPDTPNEPNVLILRLNSNGTVSWNGKASVYPSFTSSNDSDIANGIVESNQGYDFAVAGWTNSGNPPSSTLGGHNILFITFPNDGEEGTICHNKYNMTPLTFTTSTYWTTTNNLNPQKTHMRIEHISGSGRTFNSKIICELPPPE